MHDSLAAPSMLMARHMKRCHQNAFTKWDLLICLATVAMLVIALPFLPFHRHRCGSRISCVSNLKQVSLGFRMWSNDHEERFPWQAPVARGGTKEFAHLPYAALHFVVVSNELNSPKILTCSRDTNRIRTNVWEAPLHLSLSYFAGLNADETKPDTILSGDRNISTNSSILIGLFDVQKPDALQWTRDIHQHAGNIALADGSVSQTTTETVRKTFRRALATSNSIRLAIP